MKFLPSRYGLVSLSLSTLYTHAHRKIFNTVRCAAYSARVIRLPAAVTGTTVIAAGAEVLLTIASNEARKKSRLATQQHIGMWHASRSGFYYA